MKFLHVKSTSWVGSSYSCLSAVFCLLADYCSSRILVNTNIYLESALKAFQYDFFHYFSLSGFWIFSSLPRCFIFFISFCSSLWRYGNLFRFYSFVNYFKVYSFNICFMYTIKYYHINFPFPSSRYPMLSYMTPFQIQALFIV